MKYKDLPGNNKFCPLPWLGAMVLPQGTFKSCCIQELGNTAALDSNLENFTIDEIRQSEYWNNVRKDLIHGTEHPSCNNCWNLERNNLKSIRNIRNNEFLYYMKDVMENLEIDVNGELTDNTIYHWDVRQTNLCNMKCVSCGPEYSSLINAEHNLENRLNIKSVIDANDTSKQDIFEQVDMHIEKVNSFYFAGGEPIISDLHWKILDRLIETNNTTVRLSYNTNLLKLSYKGKNAIDYWKQFENVNISASIDSVGTRAEYVRFGTVWSVIDSNMKQINQELPTASGVSITTSILTIGGLDETIRWAKQFQYDIEEHKLLCNNLVYTPEFLSIKILPVYLKNSIWLKIKDELASLKDMRAYGAIEHELFTEVDHDKLIKLQQSFKQYINRLDKIRNADITVACPELSEWFSGL